MDQQSATPEVKKSVRITAYLLFTMLLLGLAVLATELYFRSNPSYGRAGFTYDNEIIYRLTPGLKAQKPYAWGKTGDPPFVLRFNNRGFRGPDIVKRKPENTKRVLVLGDSYTAGLDYPDNEIFTAQWEAYLNETSGDSYQVINASCPAWGSDQQYVYWKTEGKKLKPDELVIMFSPNDMREMANHGLISLAENEKDVVIHDVDMPLKERLGWTLAANSSFFQYLQFEVFHSNHGEFLRVFNRYPVNYGVEDSTDWDRPLFLKETIGPVAESYTLLERLLLDLQADCQEIGATLHVVKLPIELEINATYQDSSVYDQRIIETTLNDLCQRNQIDFYNFNERLRAKENPNDIFMDWEFHYDKDGHDWIAEQLSTQIKL